MSLESGPIGLEIDKFGRVRGGKGGFDVFKHTRRRGTIFDIGSIRKEESPKKPDGSHKLKS